MTTSSLVADMTLERKRLLLRLEQAETDLAEARREIGQLLEMHLAMTDAYRAELGPVATRRRGAGLDASSPRRCGRAATTA